MVDVPNIINADVSNFFVINEYLVVVGLKIQQSINTSCTKMNAFVVIE